MGMFTIAMAEASGFKTTQTFSITADGMARLLRCYDHCYACAGNHPGTHRAAV